MRVLVVCSTTAGNITSFVSEQVNSVQKLTGVEFDYAEIKSSGAIGYLKGYFSF